MNCTEYREHASAPEPAAQEAADAHRADCHACASWSQTLEDAMSAIDLPDVEPAPGDWERLSAALDAADAPTPPVHVRLQCSYCHDTLVGGTPEAAYCASCLAPHHADCFRQNAGCATPACPGVSTVTPQRQVTDVAASRGKAQKPRGEPGPSRVLPLLLTALLGGLGAAAWVALRGVEVQVQDAVVQQGFDASCGRLIQGDYRAAQEGFRRLLDEEPEAVLRAEITALDRVARVLRDCEEEPLGCDWDGALDALTRAQERASIPRVRRWLEQRQDWAIAAQGSLHLLERGYAAGAASVAAAEAREFEQALLLQREARELLTQVQGPLAATAQAQIVETWIPVLKASVAMIQRFMGPKTKPPHWGRAEDMIVSLLPLALEDKEREELIGYLEICRNNMEDETLYAQAVQIAQRRSANDYPKALALLRRIRTSSVIYPDARAYLDWIAADQLVRAAVEAFDGGRGEEALRLLREAGDEHDAALGEAARKSVDEKVVLISQVLSRWQRAKNLGTRAEALKPLEEVIALLEDRPENEYRIMAQLMFDRIGSSLGKNAETYLEEGLRQLEAAFGDGFNAPHAAEGAMAAFERVLEDPGHKRDQIVRIKSAVSQREGDTRFLYRAEKLRKANRTDTYGDLLPRLKLLKTWLPPGKQQSQASELYRQIAEGSSWVPPEFRRPEK